jgi:hypothetical protein
MGPVTTPVRQLIERLSQYSERQQILLRALHEFTAERVAEAARRSSSGVTATADWVLESMLPPDIDRRLPVGLEPEPQTRTAETVSLEPVPSQDGDLAIESSTLACNVVSVAPSSYPPSGDVPVSSASNCDAPIAPSREEPDATLVAGAQDRAPLSSSAQATPFLRQSPIGERAPSAEGLQLFRDLEVKLTEPSKESNRVK